MIEAGIEMLKDRSNRCRLKQEFKYKIETWNWNSSTETATIKAGMEVIEAPTSIFNYFSYSGFLKDQIMIFVQKSINLRKRHFVYPPFWIIFTF